MSRFMRPAYNLFEAYTPGEQPGDKPYIKLNTNESPFPPSREAALVITQQAIEQQRLYCDPECVKLREALANRHQLKPGQVLCGNGSDELLSFAFMAWGHRGVCYPDISYGLYPVLSDLHGLKATCVPLRADYSVDDRDYRGLNRLIVIANPNAPTGMALPPRQLALIAEQNPDGLVLVDEAYVDFGADSCLPLINRYENLVVVQTFSKSRSLAGARLGMAFGPEALIRDLTKIKNAINPYNVSRLTQIMGVASLADEPYFERCRAAIIAARESCAKGLSQLGFLVLPSKANFIFARYPGMDGAVLQLALRKRGILVRHFKGERTKDFIRISVGTAEQMNRVLQELSDITGGKAP